MSLLKKIAVRLTYAKYAWDRINTPHLGDMVKYRDQDCQLIQGVADPYWDLMPMSKENLDRDKRFVHRRIHVSEFKLDSSLSRKVWAFRDSYRFKMQNWYSIDIRF